MEIREEGAQWAKAGTPDHANESASCSQLSGALWGPGWPSLLGARPKPPGEWEKPLRAVLIERFLLACVLCRQRGGLN